MTAIRKAFAIAASDMGPRQVRVVCSTGTVDRAGEVVVQSGIQLADYRANPVVLFAHDPTQPIGRCTQIGIVGQELQADIEFAPQGVSAKADEICGLVKAGVISTVSIGFDPIEVEPMDPRKPKGPQRYLSIDLMELSVVSIPANPNAQVIARSARAAKEIEKWICGAADDLPLAAGDETWNGRDATKRVLDHFGFDGDDPNVEEAAKAFLAHDSGAPTLRGSYKLPFADIAHGKLVAVPAGIRAAESRLDQTDIPATVRADAEKIIAAYKTKIEDADKKAADGDKGARAAVTRGAAPASRVKTLFDIANLAYLLDSLGYAQERARIEASLEGDESKMPAMLAAIMQDLGAALVAMTAEEVNEAIAEAKGALGEDEQLDDDGLPDDDLAAIEMAATPALKSFRLRYARLKMAVGRIKEGRKISSDTSEQIKSAIEQHKEAMDHHRTAMRLHTKAIKAMQDLVDGADPAADDDDGNVTDTQSSGSDGTSGDDTDADAMKFLNPAVRRAAAARLTRH
jgi:HK97 family phage prohead protease